MIFLWICAGSARIEIAALFAKRGMILGKRAAFSQQKARIMALYKMAHCGAAIKVRHFWWEKSGTHAAIFSSAAAARLLHSF